MTKEFDENNFFLNKDTYQSDFLPVYKNIGINPIEIYQTSVKLPFHVPLKYGTYVTMALSNKSAFTLGFLDINTKNKFEPGIITPTPIEIPITRSIAQFNLVTEIGFEISFNKSGEDLVTELFDYCLDKLNYFITSYLIVTEDISAHRITLRMFEVGSLYRIINPENWTFDLGFFILHQDIEFRREELTLDKTNEIISYANVINQEWNPFILSKEIGLNAKRDFEKGLFRNAIINCQTSLETFLQTLLIELYSTVSKSEEDVNQIFENKGFVAVLKSEFHPFLNGIWNVTKEDSVIGAWYNKCYKVRNQIIHKGEHPTSNQVDEAIFATEKLIFYIVNLVVKKKKELTRLNKLLTNKRDAS